MRRSNKRIAKSNSDNSAAVSSTLEILNSINKRKTFADKKTQILNQAARLFAEKGYHTTTLDEIAGTLGITKAALYHYFPSKANILRGIMQKSVAYMTETVKLGDSNCSPIEKLRNHILFTTQVAALTTDEAKVFFEQIHLLPIKTRNVLVQKEKTIMKTLQDILQEGNDAGVFNVKDIKICSYAILGLCNWTYHWYKPNGRLTPKEIADIAVDIILNGVLNH